MSQMVPCVSPLSKLDIEAQAKEIVTKHFPGRLTVPGPLPVMKLFEDILPDVYKLKTGAMDLSPGVEGMAFPNGLIVVSEETYRGACNHEGRPRFTITVEEAIADKAYAAASNFKAVDDVGGTFYAAFKATATGGIGGLYGKMFHYFAMNKEEYLAHYHRRSMIESTFSAVKRKFGDSLRAKTDLAMKNETLAKFVCQNVSCVVAGIYERGIDPTFLGLDGKPDMTPRDVLRFVSRTFNQPPAQ